MLRNVAMRPRHQIQRLIQHRIIGKIGGGQGATFDKRDHQHTRFMVNHRRRHPGGMGGAAGREFVEPQDLV